MEETCAGVSACEEPEEVWALRRGVAKRHIAAKKQIMASRLRDIAEVNDMIPPLRECTRYKLSKSWPRAYTQPAPPENIVFIGESHIPLIPPDLPKSHCESKFKFTS